MSEIQLDFDAPQFVDFNDIQSQFESDLDSYFERAKEIEPKGKETKNDEHEVFENEDEHITPVKSTLGNKTKGSSRRKMRRSMSLNEHLNQLKLAESKCKPNQNGMTQKHVTMAEAIRKFYTATPPRFRTKNKNHVPHFTSAAPLPCTIPKTPNLLTKVRSHSARSLHREEGQLEKESEEKKHKIKSRLTSHNGLQGPAKAAINLKKASEKPMTPTTIPIPFSFEERDKLLMKKKQERIMKVLEEEKKAREFHANPLPRNLFKSQQNGLVSKQNSSNSLNSQKTDETDTVRFKARPAKVLQMKPFEPKREERTLTEITDIQLNTEKRAKERERFEQEQKRKEMQNLLIKQQHEERQRMLEEEEIARLRKEAEHKAQPIRRYKELPAVPKKLVTVPASPKFNFKNKENSHN